MEFPVNVMELIFVLAVAFFEILLINFFKVVKIVRALFIYTFVYNKVSAVFLMNK